MEGAFAKHGWMNWLCTVLFGWVWQHWLAIASRWHLYFNSNYRTFLNLNNNFYRVKIKRTLLKPFIKFKDTGKSIQNNIVYLVQIF